MYHTIWTNARMQTYMCKLIKLGWNLMKHYTLTNALMQSYLNKFFDHTWQELNVSFHSDKCS
jgi:hypothetical protein